MGIIRREIWTLDEDFELQEDYPTSWDKEEFKKQTSFAARKKYADQHLQKLGSGSARHVYAIDDEKALKLAANRKGLDQNADEHKISTIGWHDDVVARVFDSHPDDLWIESELARKIKPTRFRELTGFNIQDVGAFLNQYNDERNGRRVSYGKLSDNLYQEMVNNEFIMDILSIVDNWDMQTGDWGRISSYGEVKRNGKPQVVLINYGLTQDTYKTHYDKSQNRPVYENTLKREGISKNLINRINEMMKPIVDQGDLEKLSTDNTQVYDGGYGGFALQPDSVSQGGLNSDIDENLDKFSNVNTKAIQSAINSIKTFDPSKISDLYKKSDLINIYNSYMIAARNTEEVLSASSNEVNFYDKLMLIQDFLKRLNIVNENLEYNHVNDASPESDKYQLAEYEEVINDKFKEETIHDIAKNASERLGYHGELSYMGKGDNGYEYDLGDGKVLKITGSETEAAESLRLKGKDNQHLAKIFNVYQINKEHIQLYIVLQEKIDTSRQGEMGQYSKELNSSFSKNINKPLGKLLMAYYTDPNLYNMVYADKIEKSLELNNVSENAKNFYYGLIGIMDEVKAAKLDTIDFFLPSNLGYKNGNLVFFDFGGRYDKSIGKKKPKQMKMGEGGDSLYMTQNGTRDEDFEEDMGEMNERITSYMPKSKKVSVKKKCVIGGNEDGTSTACNKGDINNFDIEEINDDNTDRRKDNFINVAEDDETNRYYFETMISEEIKRNIAEDYVNDNHTRNIIHSYINIVLDKYLYPNLDNIIARNTKSTGIDEINLTPLEIKDELPNDLKDVETALVKIIHNTEALYRPEENTIYLGFLPVEIPSEFKNDRNAVGDYVKQILTKYRDKIKRTLVHELTHAFDQKRGYLTTPNYTISDDVYDKVYYNNSAETNAHFYELLEHLLDLDKVANFNEFINRLVGRSETRFAIYYRGLEPKKKRRMIGRLYKFYSGYIENK